MGRGSAGDHGTVQVVMQATMAGLTQSERQVASVILQDYPVAGLQSITQLAATAKVSTPTVIRMARKLGFEGFSGLQDALHAEISAQIKKPAAKLGDRRGQGDGDMLDRFTASAIDNLQNTLTRLDRASFAAVARMLANPDRRVYIEGGRITRSNADYLFNHLQILRPGVTALGRTPSVWPQYLLDIDAACIVVLFDIRRYESDLLKLARLAKERGASLVLITDQWGSPIGGIADHVFHVMIEAPSSWDSTVAMMVLLEALIAEVQAQAPDRSQARMEDLESMFTATRMFRDFK